ncbi:hypothetical protein Tco_0023738, partial [Tanacetum coccineum]
MYSLTTINVHPGKLCPLNKRYDLMDANKKVDLEHVIGIYNGAEDIIKFQDNWSSAAMANVMKDILQMLNNTCNSMGSTAVADNANDSQPTESTQGTHRTPNAPRSPNPNKEAAESSAPRRSTMIHLCIPERRSIRLTPPAPVPNVDKADEMILQDILQHLASEEIDKMVEGQENVVDDSSILSNDESNIPSTRIEPRSNKESPKVEITKDKEV